MSCLVDNRAKQKEKLDSIVGAFSAVSSKKEETNITFEKNINKLLDDILDAKEFLQSNADEIGALVPKLEEVTWFTDIDEELLPSIEELITSLERLSKAMVRNYVSYNRFLTNHKVAKKELSNYKSVADEIGEIASDLRAIFFTLPSDKEFQALNQELSSL
jgi:ABC-type transporter Mla subunit MlaD